QRDLQPERGDLVDDHGELGAADRAARRSDERLLPDRAGAPDDAPPQRQPEQPPAAGGHRRYGRLRLHQPVVRTAASLDGGAASLSFPLDALFLGWLNRGMHIRLPALLISSLLLASTSTALADDVAAAKMHYEKGTTLFDLQRYLEAARE